MGADITTARGAKASRADKRAEVAFGLEQTIKTAMGDVHRAWWTLSAALYEFHEAGYWTDLGYDTLDEFLAQPELSISRTQFFTMTRVWRQLVVTRKVDPDDLADIEPSKVKEVVPAISKGDVAVDDALDDARSLGVRDLREKYGAARNQHKQAPDDSTPLDASTEIERVQCELCGSWYVPDPDDEEG